MIRIAKTRETNASVDRVWDVISNLDNEKKYWTLIKNIKVLSTNGNTIERETTIMRGPMGNVKSLQTLVLDPKKSLILKMRKGPLIGNRKVALNPSGKGGTRIDVTWEFEPLGIPKFAHSFVKNNISTVTENALIQILKDAEHSASPKSRL